MTQRKPADKTNTSEEELVDLKVDEEQEAEMKGGGEWVIQAIETGRSGTAR